MDCKLVIQNKNDISKDKNFFRGKNICLKMFSISHYWKKNILLNFYFLHFLYIVKERDFHRFQYEKDYPEMPNIFLKF